LSVTEISRAFAVGRGRDVPVAEAAGKFPSYRSLASLVYSRAATVLETFARAHGRERLERGRASYARRHRFAHPEPEDLLAALRSEIGPDATAQLEAALFRRADVNYVVRDLKNAPERTPGGVFDAAGEREPTVEGSRVPGRFRGRAVVYRQGSLELPVEILLTDADGRQARTRWNGQAPFFVVEHAGQAPLDSVVVDPDRRILLDSNLFDNAASVSPAYPWRTLERASYYVTLALGLFGP
jgi:hypothetical protein